MSEEITTMQTTLEDQFLVIQNLYTAIQALENEMRELATQLSNTTDQEARVKLREATQIAVEKLQASIQVSHSTTESRAVDS